MMFSVATFFLSMIGCGGVGLSPSGTATVTTSEYLNIDPEGTIDFGQHFINSDPPAPKKKTIVLSGDGEGQIAIIDVWLQDSSNDTFKLPKEPLPLPLIIKPGGEFRIQMRFITEDIGFYTGELNIMYDDGTSEGATISRPLSGEGCIDC